MNSYVYLAKEARYKTDIFSHHCSLIELGQLLISVIFLEIQNNNVFKIITCFFLKRSCMEFCPLWRIKHSFTHLFIHKICIERMPGEVLVELGG